MSALIPDLSSPDPALRERAAIRLEFAPDSAAVEPLIALLNDPENRVQIAAASALGVLMDDRALEPLMRMFAGDTYLLSNGGDSPEQYFRVVRAAAWALALLAKDVDQYENIFWTFLHRLAWHDADQSPHLRAEAAAAAFGLGWLRDGRAKSVLFEAAQYGAGRVKDAVIEVLGWFHDLDVRPILLDALNLSTSYEIVGKAAESLSFLRDPDMIPALIAVAERNDDRFVVDLAHRQQARMRHVASRYIRLRVGRALAWLAQASDDDTSAQIGGVFERWLIHRDSHLREAAAVGLALRGDGRALDGLIAALNTKDDDSLPILLYAIDTLNDARATPALEALIASGHAAPRDLEWMRQIVWKLSQ
ncbi:MAG: HEAT repeat domain-containing protein [Chloroflexota bacterium]|nr:HEAT repeat domain-containing protein [Chloroflexota bacterium]